MSIGVVIVTYNNVDTVASCVRSIRDCGTREIVVVDNASSDFTRDVLKGLPIRVVHNDKNEGFAAAANRGARQLDTQYILFLNPDAQLQGAIEPAVDYLNLHPQVGVLGFFLCGKDGRPERYNFGNDVTPISLITRRITYDVLRITNYEQPSAVGWVSGGAMFVRRSVFSALGGFDPRFFLYWEDVDLCRRVRDSGQKVVFFPRISVYHRRGSSLRDMRQKVLLYDQSADRYMRKYYPTLICSTWRLARRTYRYLSPLAR